jgi:hypothetical protein
MPGSITTLTQCTYRKAIMLRSATDYEPEDFDSWFSKLPLNAEVMSLIFQLYQYDQLGKMNQESLVVNLSVKKRIPANLTTESHIDKLSTVLSLGLLDDVARISRKRKTN